MRGHVDDHLLIDGFPLHYRVDGDGRGPWIVFSNSLATNLSVWDKQVAVFGDRFRILRYDQRGHGTSGIPAETPTFQRLAQDVLALLDHLGIDRCTYVGLSMGVPTGLALWREAPSRLSRLVLVDGQPKTQPSGGAAWRERIEFARQNGMDAFALATAERWFPPHSLEAGLADGVAEAIRTTPLEGFAPMAATLISYDFEDALATITVPTLLIVGELDGQTPAIMEGMHRMIAGSRYEVIPGAGHISNWEAHGTFNGMLEGFLLDSPVRHR